MLRRSLAILLVIILYVSPSYGWNANGHMMVASIAYSQLSEAQRKNVLALLQQHPQYTEWKRRYDVQVQLGTLDLCMYLMMQASRWADDIRDRRHADHQYDEPKWHYVTYKMRFPNQHETTLPDPKKEPNVVWAIENAKSIINDPKIDKKERAIYLAWLIHLIGDVHQPLHCASLFNNEYKKGDRGGNGFWVMPHATGMKLHSLWDGALGGGKKIRNIVNRSIELRNEHSKAGMNLKFAPVAWSMESFDHAVNDVHLKGNLKGSTKEKSAPALPEGYTTDMKELAAERASWAGYRLGKTIEELRIKY